MVITDFLTSSRVQAYHDRVEKYRPDTLDDVSGHQDILATINKFVDTNVYILSFHGICHMLMLV